MQLFGKIICWLQEDQDKRKEAENGPFLNKLQLGIPSVVLLVNTWRNKGNSLPIQKSWRQRVWAWLTCVCVMFFKSWDVEVEIYITSLFVSFSLTLSRSYCISHSLFVSSLYLFISLSIFLSHSFFLTLSLSEYLLFSHSLDSSFSLCLCIFLSLTIYTLSLFTLSGIFETFEKRFSSDRSMAS